jgi:asparagine synthase (glutamine-hydrolysing)
VPSFVGRLWRGETPEFRCAPRSICADGLKIAFDGYIANREDLLAQFGSPSTLWCAETEIVALAFRRWGSAAASHVLGEYAFAVYDPRERSLLLAHDALGIIPLFFSISTAVVTFGSELSDVVAETGVGTLDEDYIADFFAGVAERGERTPYRHIRRLRAGHSAVISDGAVTDIESYDSGCAVPLRLSDAGAYEERLRELLIAAVARSLPAGGTVWSELSGGLDSSSVLSVASKCLHVDVEAFSLVFGRSHSADESEWIDAVLETYPVPSHRLDADTVPPFAELPTEFFGEPCGAPLIRALRNARDRTFAAHGVDVVLSGSSGDALFFGDAPEPYFLADMLLSHPPSMVRHLRMWQREWSQPRPLTYWLGRYVYGPYRRRLAGKSVVAAAGLAPWIDADYAAKMQLQQRSERRRVFGHDFAREDFWDKIQRGAALVSRVQRPLNARTVYRNPLLYIPLVEFMASVPSEQAFGPGRDRDLQRRALRGILPERTRQRRGKRSSTQSYFLGLEREDNAWNALLRQSVIADRGYVDRKAWHRAIDRARVGASLSGFLQTCMLAAWFASLSRVPARSTRLDRTTPA